MDLIISGMALSYQWWPTLKHFLESLPEKKDLSPALVEHFGEVILQALADAQPLAESRLSIIRDSSQADLGHYLPLLRSDFSQVDQIQPNSPNLIAQIEQAAGLIRDDPNHHAVLCDLSRFGSAAVVLSHPSHQGRSHARVLSPADPACQPSRADQVVITAIDQWNSEAAALLKDLYQGREGGHPVALNCSAAGGFVSAELVSLIQAALAVDQKLIPAWNQKIDPSLKSSLPDPLYINQEFRPWLARGKDFSRSALLLSRKPKNGWGYLLVKELVQPAREISLRLRSGTDPYLLPVSGSDQIELVQHLDALEELVLGPGSLKSIAGNVYTKYYSAEKPFTCSLLGRNREELLKELAHAKTGIREAFQTGKTWSSPAGSYFTSQALGSSRIAFVYPGAFNSYPGMGRDLFFSFPGLAESAGALIPDLSHSLAEDFLYLRSSKSPSSQAADQIMKDFYQHPSQLVESGLSISVLYTLILDQIFQLRPDAAFGYSLGEASMLWANRVWQDAQASSLAWEQSNLFKDELVGKMAAVRSFWGDHELPEDFWVSFILKADQSQAEAACQAEPLAFLTIKNAPNEVVIAGEREACQRVIQSLECHALPMPFNAAIHNPAVEACLPAFAALYSNRTSPGSEISFFSAADYQELVLEEKALADSMARMTCSPVDFPRLVEAVYQSGARLFIEIGPQKTCSRWIEKILQGKPHAVAPINKKYQPDLQGILKVISLLLSHGVHLNLDALYPEIPARQPDVRPERISSSSSRAQDQAQPAAQIIPAHPDAQDRPSRAGSLAEVYFEHLDRVSADLARSHQDFLNNQSILTRNLVRVMEIQAGGRDPSPSLVRKTAALYSRDQIQAFTEGDHRICFGNTFAGFGDRRIPRLPNGELQFIDRVLSIQGQPEIVEEKSSLISEYDLPEQSWYRNGSPGSLPHVSLLEIALQPCGFLSAYMGTIKGRESQDLYFRNLDGEGTLLAWPASPGKTISNRVELLSSSSLENVIIQNYAFELSWGDEPFYKGTSSFGYFPQAMLANQAGLDGAQTAQPWFSSNPQAGTWNQIKPSPPRPESDQIAHLPELNQLWISRQGGDYSQGYIFAREDLSPEAWFYRAHFFQDPVMPGSLGVEAMARALISAAPAFGIPPQSGWRVKTGANTRWKYRGQITPEVKGFEIELHLKNITRSSTGWEITADGQLWKESIRIYQVENLSLESSR